MAITQVQLDQFVTNKMCCLADEGYKLLNHIKEGTINVSAMLHNAYAADVILSALKDYDITTECFTDEEIYYMAEQLDSYCCECC